MTTELPDILTVTGTDGNTRFIPSTELEEDGVIIGAQMAVLAEHPAMIADALDTVRTKWGTEYSGIVYGHALAYLSENILAPVLENARVITQNWLRRTLKTVLDGYPGTGVFIETAATQLPATNGDH